MCKKPDGSDLSTAHAQATVCRISLPRPSGRRSNMRSNEYSIPVEDQLHRIQSATLPDSKLSDCRYSLLQSYRQGRHINLASFYMKSNHKQRSVVRTLPYYLM